MINSGLEPRPTVWPGRRRVPIIIALGFPGEHLEQIASHYDAPAADLRWPIRAGRYGVQKSVISFLCRDHGRTPRE
jgi:hypothetical protein